MDAAHGAPRQTSFERQGAAAGGQGIGSMSATFSDRERTPATF